MNEAKLHGRFREHGFDGFGETFQAVNTGDKDVFDASVLEFGDD